jgi:hypothetical protein
MIKRILAFVVMGMLATGVAARAADAPKNDYVGAGKCKMCHNGMMGNKQKVYDAWAATKHARAFASLKATTPEQLKKMNELLKTTVKDHPETDAACVSCHVTGYKQPGGYPGADSLKSAVVAFVGCEACHGPGSQHLAVPMSDKAGRKASMLVPTVETCKKCHTPELSPKFDFAVMSKMVHPAAAAAPAK